MWLGSSVALQYLLIPAGAELTADDAAADAVAIGDTTEDAAADAVATGDTTDDAAADAVATGDTADDATAELTAEAAEAAEDATTEVAVVQAAYALDAADEDAGAAAEPVGAWIWPDESQQSSHKAASDVECQNGDSPSLI